MSADERLYFPPLPSALDPHEKDSLAFRMAFPGREPPSVEELKRRVEEKKRVTMAEETTADGDEDDGRTDECKNTKKK